MRLARSVALTLLASAAYAAPALAVEPQAPEALMTRAQAISISVQDRLAETFTNSSVTHKADHGALVEFYAGQSKPVWMDESGLTDRGSAVIAEIRDADDWGLRASDFELPADTKFESGTGAIAAKLANAEITISYAVLDYARQARGGRADALKSGIFDPTLTPVDPLEAIQTAANHAEPAHYLTELHPQHPQFIALRKKLGELRGPKKEEPKEEKKIVHLPDGPLLRVGVKHEQVALLRARLEAPAGDGVDSETFDEALAAAVRAFQASKGLGQDGLVGPRARRLMNGQNVANARPAPSREKQILINMERWRYVPRELGDLHVNVNVPEQIVRVREKGKTIFTERVVVGKTKTPTPIFSHEVETVVFNPYWNMPNSIKTGEIRPSIRMTGGGFFSPSVWDTRVIDRHNLKVRYRGRVVDPQTVPWDEVDVRQLHFFQPPGSWNVLGNLKFVFPNKHDVYLHDTNSKSLFANEVRMESHGCVRVRNPDQLAQVLLDRRAGGGWSMSRVHGTIGNSHDMGVRLTPAVPIHITYFTLWVNDDGSLQTHGDVYGQDARLAAALKL